MPAPEITTFSDNGLHIYNGVETLYEDKPHFGLTGRVALKLYEGVAALPDDCIDHTARRITLHEENSLPMPIPACSEFLLHTTTYDLAAISLGRRAREIIAMNTAGYTFEEDHQPEVAVQTFSDYDLHFDMHPKFKFNLSLQKLGISKLVWATFGEAWESISISGDESDALSPTPWKLNWQNDETTHEVPIVSPAFLLFMEMAAQQLNGASPEVIDEFNNTHDALQKNPLWASDVAQAQERYDIFMQKIREKYPKVRDVRRLLGKRSALAIVRSGRANAQLHRSARRNYRK